MFIEAPGFQDSPLFFEMDMSQKSVLHWMCALLFIISFPSSFTHLCVADEFPSDDTAALETPAPEADAAPEPVDEDHTAEVRSGNIF